MHRQSPPVAQQLRLTASFCKYNSKMQLYMSKVVARLQLFISFLVAAIGNYFM